MVQLSAFRRANRRGHAEVASGLFENPNASVETDAFGGVVMIVENASSPARLALPQSFHRVVILVLRSMYGPPRP